MGQKTFRFGVCSTEGLRGASWSLKVHEKNTGEVETYLYARPLGGAVKTSFHSSGECHAGFTREYHDVLRRKDPTFRPNRHLEEWKIDSLEKGGVAAAYHIITPPSSLIHDPIPLPNGFISIPPPAPEMMRMTTLFMFGPNAKVTFRGTNLMQLCKFGFQNGRSLCLFSADIPLVSFTTDTLQGQLLVGRKDDIPAQGNLRAIAQGDFEGWGHRARAMFELRLVRK